MLGAVLAGGRSRRFGTDKTVVEVRGSSMTEHGLHSLRAVCDDVVVVSSRASSPTEWGRVIPDLRADTGPLAGIEAALHFARASGMSSVFVLAADLPLVTSSVIEAVVTAPEAGSLRADTPGAIAAARAGDPDFEPLCALYSVACADTATQLLDSGERAARALMVAVQGRSVALNLSEMAAVSANVNTPEDLEGVQ